MLHLAVMVLVQPPLLPAISSSLVSRSLCHRQYRRCCVSRLLRDGKARSHLALDRGACQPHTVIIPELTSPLSIELLRRWGGHKISCSEKQHCSGPRGLRVKNECRCIKEKKDKTLDRLLMILFSSHTSA